MAKPTPKMISLVMKELSRRGASKGGKARAKSLSKRRRVEIAKRAIAARWKKEGSK